MWISPYAVLVYGVFVVLGGIIGYLQAQSKPSLIAGGISGLLLVGSGLLMIKGLFAGTIAALVITLALTIMFSQRYAAKRKFMPAGLMLVLSTLMAVLLITSMMMHLLFGDRG